jgi:hypothetical protein
MRRLRREQRLGGRRLVAGVEHALRAGAYGCVDRRPAGLGGAGAHDRGRDDEHLVGGFEGVVEGGGVGEVARAYADAALGERRGHARVADAHADGVGGNAVEQALDDLGAEASSGTGDDDHGSPS